MRYGTNAAMDAPSLEDCCFSYILFDLELFPVDYLALLPTRMRRKLLFQLPVADICRLQETAVVEGVDMNLVWKERSQARAVPHFPAPSTREELRCNQGYKQWCNKYVFGMILRGKTDEAKAMLCHIMPIRWCVQATCSVRVEWMSIPSDCVPSTLLPLVRTTKNLTLLAMAIQYFRRESEFGGLDWTTGLEYWTTGILDWTTGILEYWTGLLEYWIVGMEKELNPSIGPVRLSYAVGNAR